jgi:hypothetical protein
MLTQKMKVNRKLFCISPDPILNKKYAEKLVEEAKDVSIIAEELCEEFNCNLIGRGKSPTQPQVN